MARWQAGRARASTWRCACSRRSAGTFDALWRVRDLGERSETGGVNAEHPALTGPATTFGALGDPLVLHGDEEVAVGAAGGGRCPGELGLVAISLDRECPVGKPAGAQVNLALVADGEHVGKGDQADEPRQDASVGERAPVVGQTIHPSGVPSGGGGVVVVLGACWVPSTTRSARS